MYEIRVGDETLYYAGDKECTITAGILKQSLNEAGSLDITIPSSNPFYNRIKQRGTELTLYQDDKPIWIGEVREVSSDFYKYKSIYAVGELAYLTDSIQPFKKYDRLTKVQIFTALINEHNSQVEARKRFEVGAIAIKDGMFTMVTNWENTLDFIRDKLLGYSEYVRVRWYNGKRYLDLVPLDSYGVKSEQYIEFGENLLDLAESTSAESLYTAVIPLGAAKEESSIEDYEDYITIESVNDNKNYVYSEQAVKNYGWIKTVVNFDDITDPNQLKQKGLEWIRSNQYERFTYKLTAVDLSMIDKSVAAYNVGDYIRAISEPHDMDTWLPVRSREIDLLNLANNKLTVGSSSHRNLTSTTYTQVQELEDKMPDEPKIIKTALKNSSALINSNGEKGNVAIRVDAKGKPYEIDVMNADSFEQSTQIWRWNLSGFGFGTKPAGGKEVTWRADAAITMNGAINANFITAGIMSADRVQGGTFLVGGNGSAKDGSIYVYDTNNTLLGYWDNTGIHLFKGEMVADLIKGGTLIIGGNGLEKDGSIVVRNEANVDIGSWSKSGLTVNSGTISGSSIIGGTITLGGKTDVEGVAKDGTITVKDANDTTIGFWNASGINAQAGNIGPFQINGKEGEEAYSGLLNPFNGLHISWGSDKVIYIGSYKNPAIELNKNGKIYCSDLYIDGFSRLSKYLQQLKDQDLIED